jgi:hypothetical protein
MKKILKKALKIFAWTLGIVVVLGTIGYFAMDEKRPVATEGAEAEALTDKLLAAVNKPAYDSLHYLQWTYRGNHHYLWDKQRNLAEVTHGKRRVVLQPDSLRGLAYEDGKPMEGKAQDDAVQKDLTAFWNDGFWLIAPFKVRDPGTKRGIVVNEDGSKSLMVTYDSGGRTPGDHYLWHLDANGRPTAWQLWVKILPIGGLRFGWEDWQQLPGGAWVASSRTTKLMDLHVDDIKGGQAWSDFGRERDPFEALNAWLPQH